MFYRPGTRAGTLAAMVAATAAGVEAQAHPPKQAALQVPSTIAEEHQEIHEQLERAAKLSGRVGEAAREVAHLLEPHFKREEQIALPPLSLLKALGDGKFEPAMLSMLPITDSLAAELPKMLAEHVPISAATKKLRQVALANGNQQVAELARNLIRHARNEEEVLYPAAMLVGRWLRSQAHGHSGPVP